MDEISSLTPGTELNNDQLREIFGCGPQGGMRRSHATNTLVLVSDHYGSIYDDRWIDGVLHYTGMGQKGDQSLTFMQNRTLAESGTNGVSVHLFEVFTPKPKQYVYAGEVALAGDPYQEVQPDEAGEDRLVWVFPLALKSGEPPALSNEILKELQDRKARQTRRLSDAEIAERAKNGGQAKVGTRRATIQQHQRNPYVVEHAKRRAKGSCELCGSSAPFKGKDGQPYLETHHIVWLARGGADTIENTVALCPNCHRRMHVVDAASDRKKLQAVAEGKE